jgi:hypothetical protein
MISALEKRSLLFFVKWAETVAVAGFQRAVNIREERKTLS